MYRINEIFYSLQGEGYHTGTPAVFVRFSGCNLRCPFCDTDFAAYREMSAEDITAAVQTLSKSASAEGEGMVQESTLQRSKPLIVLTGGEPALQADEALVAALHGTGMSVCIETNGTHALPDGIDWVTCSPKEGTRLALTRADELKVVLTEGTDPEQWLPQITAKHLFLQPCSCQNTEQVVAYILAHPHWRLSLQTHKYLHIR
ncbi:MAG: 7-carboxy-7-deazaguanine synthase QueE [Paludibacteraceae bacterium]